MPDATADLLQLNQRLLEAIAAADWATYEDLCAPDLTAFEPEARGHRVAGMAFHRFYFDLGAGQGSRHTTMAEPHVRWLGDDAAVITCVRLVQAQTPGGPVTTRCEETRVWERQDGRWQHVHFHRSNNG